MSGLSQENPASRGIITEIWNLLGEADEALRQGNSAEAYSTAISRASSALGSVRTLIEHIKNEGYEFLRVEEEGLGSDEQLRLIIRGSNRETHALHVLRPQNPGEQVRITTEILTK